jgi:hypothetical protein
MTTSTGTIVYSGRVTNWPVVLLSVALGGGLVAGGQVWRGPWPGMLVPLGLVVAMLAFLVLTSTNLRVIVNPGGVVVRLGALGWPRFRYATTRIQRIEHIGLSRWSSAAWGSYWSPRHGLFLTMRSGPALRLVLGNGRRVTISVPDAWQAGLPLGDSVEHD